MTKKPHPQLITADLSLKNKLGKNVNLKNIFNEERIAAGQQAIQEVQDDFISDMTAQITPLIEMGRKNPNSARARGLFISTAASQKGKAESLGYKVLALTLNSLSEYSQNYLPDDKHAAIIVGKHIDLLEIALREKVVGDGSKTSNEILEALPELIAHFHPSGK
ncbi:MAG: hypothetical protein P8P30_01070 [Rickettsiales bacterium]|nr:hypothetical protein [Rickettsiales bacterium]